MGTKLLQIHIQLFTIIVWFAANTVKTCSCLEELCSNFYNRMKMNKEATFINTVREKNKQIMCNKQILYNYYYYVVVSCKIINLIFTFVLLFYTILSRNFFVFFCIQKCFKPIINSKTSSRGRV